MKTNLTLVLIFLFSFCHAKASEKNSIQNFNVKPGNSAAVNKVNLQKAIDWASVRGAALFVEPSEEPYHIVERNRLPAITFLPYFPFLYLH